MASSQRDGITISTRDLDLIARVVASETPNSWLRSESGTNGVKGVIDVILNRASSGSYPSSIEDVLNQKGQFSAVSGNKNAAGSADRLGRASKEMTEFVTSYIRDRANGAPSAVGGALNFANPHYADQRNLGWINAMERAGGQTFGRGGKDIHVYGTAPGGRAHEATNIRLTGGARGSDRISGSSGTTQLRGDSPPARQDRPMDLRPQGPQGPQGGPRASGFNAGIFDRVADRVLRFGNDQIPGAPPQRNVVQEMFDKIGRGKAGIRSDAVPPSTQQRQATLREGMSGPQVKALQQDLIKAGLLDAKGADGKFGPQTAAAVRSLEKNFNLPTQDRGIAGREVFGKLGQLGSGQMPPPVPQATPTQRTAPAATPAPPPIPPPSPTASPTSPPTRAVEDALAGLVGAGKIGANSMAPLAGRMGGILGATAGAPNPPPAAPAIRPDFGQATPGQAPVARPGVGIGPMANPAQFPTPTLPPQFGPNPPPAATQALGAQPATLLMQPAALAANPPPPAANSLAAQALTANSPPPALAAQAAAALAANTPPPPTAANTPAATINALPDQALPNAARGATAFDQAMKEQEERNLVTGLPIETRMNAPQGGIPQTMVPSSPGAGMLGSQEARPSIRPDTGPPGGAANYAPRDIGTMARGIESPMFNPPQSTPQFPATGWANAPSTQPSPPPPPPARDQNALLQGLLSMGVDASNLPQTLAGMPGSVQFNPADEQRKAETQAQEMFNQMDRANALKESGGSSSYYRDLGEGAFGGGASDNLLFGGIPTVQAPPLQDIVQPQVGDQGGQGLLGGQGLGDQAPVEGGPAAGKSDAQGVLDAISEISIGGNQQDQQPGGDQSATASTASGDNTSAFTPAQLTEQQGILAMLEEMFGSGSTGR